LLLALVGVYGVVAYGVSQRQPEFGVRLALGARRQDIMRMVVRQSMWLVGSGAVAGMLLAIPATQALRSLLFGVVPGDPLTLAVVAALILVAGALASSVPAWRGTAVDPVSALRAE
jgi:ABC-type antimicrobial peptide transport system permease subunit